jgi:hypothetical protein
LFASNFYPTKSKDALKVFKMGEYSIARHEQPVALSAIPHITSDDTDEQSAYGTLFLWCPFVKESELYVIPGDGDTPARTTTAVEVLAHVKTIGRLTAKARRAREVEVMSADARAGFGALAAGQQDNGDVFDVEGIDAPEGAGIDEEYDGDDNDGCGGEGGGGGGAPAAPWASTPATSAAAGGPGHDIRVLQELEYRALRNFVATVESASKERREQSLQVFDDDSRARGGAESAATAGDFGESSSSASLSAVTEKEAELDTMVDRLSPQQRDCYDCCVHFMRPGSNEGQLRIIVAGAAGVGKSAFLRTIVLYMRLQYGSKAVEVFAQTNAAAKLVDGHTYASLFPPDITRPAGGDDKLKKKKTNAIKKFTDRFQATRLLVLEEHSLVSSEDVLHINDCFRVAFPSLASQPFAGKHVSSHFFLFSKYNNCHCNRLICLFRCYRSSALAITSSYRPSVALHLTKTPTYLKGSRVEPSSLKLSIVSLSLRIQIFDNCAIQN